jgi:hypothetical protein
MAIISKTGHVPVICSIVFQWCLRGDKHPLFVTFFCSHRCRAGMLKKISLNLEELLSYIFVSLQYIVSAKR